MMDHTPAGSKGPERRWTAEERRRRAEEIVLAALERVPGWEEGFTLEAHRDVAPRRGVTTLDVDRLCAVHPKFASELRTLVDDLGFVVG